MERETLYSLLGSRRSLTSVSFPSGTPMRRPSCNADGGAMPFKARRWLYFLTPQGALEKSRLSLNDLPRILDPSGNCAASLRLQEVESIAANLEEPHFI